MKNKIDIETTVEPLPEFERPFRQNNQGWLGGDLAFSMPLNADKILWLFGDSFIKRKPDNKGRDGAAIISNSIAVQSGSLDDENGRLNFFWRENDKSIEAVFGDNSIPGIIWPLSSVLIQDKLYVLAIRIVQDDIENAFGFRQVGNQIFEIENPGENPDAWNISVHELPWKKELGSFGSNVLIHGNFLYIYGYQMTTSVITDPPNLVIARIKLENAANMWDMCHWEFRDGKNQRWTKDREKISPVFVRSNTEFSVTFLATSGKYILVANTGKNGKHVTIRFSDTPSGPFTEPIIIYDCPEVNWNPLYFCYAVKAHPELSRKPDELIITYLTNSKSLQTCIEDTRIYYPRFIKLKLK